MANLPWQIRIYQGECKIKSKSDLVTERHACQCFFYVQLEDLK